MTEAVATLNVLSAGASIALFIVGAILILDRYQKRALAPLVSKYGLFIAFVVTVGGTVLSFIYSDVIGFTPCGLCWLQRVFLFPQAFILGAALYYGERTYAARYGIVLSVPGLIIALYQHYLQMGGSALTPCPAAAGDCARRYLFEFGFVTFPLVSAFVFVFLIAIYLYIISLEQNDCDRL